MKYNATRLAVGLLTFFLGVGLANAGLGTHVNRADEQAVLAVEREYIRAHVEADVAALDRVLADDFTSFGGRVNKGHRLALISNPLFAFDSIQTEGVEVYVQGDEAVLTGRAKTKSSFSGRAVTTPWYGFMRRYERRGGRWQIVSCAYSLSW